LNLKRRSQPSPGGPPLALVCGAAGAPPPPAPARAPDISGSQPLAGLSGARSPEDEQLLELMRGCCSGHHLTAPSPSLPSTKQLCIFDCRPCGRLAAL
jgi:hypothetical protein